jgi:outer membrane protein assembly factor BamB
VTFAVTGRVGIAAGAAAVVLGLGAGCVKVPFQRADAMRAVAPEPLGEDRLSLHWKFVTADRLNDVRPQEYATAAVYADTVYIGSATGTFFALRAATGVVRWKKPLGSVSSTPIVDRGYLYVGTDDGHLLCLDAQTGAEKWRYQSRGAIAQAPVAVGELIVFANEADQVVAVDATTGAFKWQYKVETPESYTLRGHAGVAVDGDLLYTGFANGTLVALRRDTGSVAWSTSLKGEADRFMDVDATPLVIGKTVYATSSSGGVFGLDKATGLVRWRLPFWDAAQPSATGNVGGMVSDGKTLYVSVADLGTYALDLAGNVKWRVGALGGGEPAAPLIYGDLLVYALATDGVFLADRRTGQTLQYFDPGDGISAAPAITSDGRMIVMSNRGVVYAFDLD